MVGHRLDLEAVGEAVGSKGFVCGWCHVDGLRLHFQCVVLLYVELSRFFAKWYLL